MPQMIFEIKSRAKATKWQPDSIIWIVFLKNDGSCNIEVYCNKLKVDPNLV